MIALSGLTQASNASETREKSRLTDAAQQFEAVFLQELLKPLQESADDGEEKPAGSDTMASYGREAVAKAISKGGGMGIARQIVAKIELERSQHQATKRNS